MAGVVVNDSVTRQAISRDQMRNLLKFVHDDVVFCKYYEVVYILFHTGMRISEFCGLTIKALDMENASSTLITSCSETPKWSIMFIALRQTPVQEKFR